MMKFQAFAAIILAAFTPLANSVPIRPRNQDCPVADAIEGGKIAFSVNGDTKYLFAQGGKTFTAEGSVEASTSPRKIVVNIDATDDVWVSTDAGLFIAIPGTTQAWAFVLGDSSPASGFPTVFADANIGSIGCFRSDDGGFNRIKINDATHGSGSALPNILNAEPHIYGRGLLPTSIGPIAIPTISDPLTSVLGSILPTSTDPIPVPTTSTAGNPLTSVLSSILPVSIPTGSTTGDPLTSILGSILPSSIVPIPTLTPTSSTTGDPLTSILGSILPSSIIPVPTLTPTTSAVSDPLTPILSSVRSIGSPIIDPLTSILGSIIPTSIVPTLIPTSDSLTSVLSPSSILPVPTIGNTASDPLTSILGSIIPRSIIPTPTSDPLTSILPVSSILPIPVPTIGSTIGDPLTSILSTILPTSTDPIPTPTISTVSDPLTSILSSVLPIPISTIL